MKFDFLDEEETEARLDELEMLIDDREERLNLLKEELLFRQSQLNKRRS